MTDSAPDPLQQAETWLADHGDALLAYAMRRTPSAAAAEDLVQETLLAALKAAGEFRGQAAVQTWLTGILRRKIADFYRRAARDARVEAELVEPFNADRQWRERPGDWGGDPAQIAESAEFQAALAACLEKLGPTLRPAFQLRVLDQLKTEEICSELDVTPTNLSVRLARARVLLRECLERTWFAAPQGKPPGPASD
ncbi:MAG: RNA polymerase subunit sigma [Planctomycetaceae bacterium]|nr:RNA polymerase subunit sigma [Planctomycetaceae bacterium]